MASAGRYPAAMRWMHWATGAGIISTFAFVQLAQRSKGDEKMRYMTLHKSTGLLTFGLVLPRLGIRMASKLPEHMPPLFGAPGIEHRLASFTHAAMYWFMIVMPVSGIVMGYFGGKGLPFYGYHIPGKETVTEEDKKKAGNAFQFHKRQGWIFQYIAVPGHIAAAGVHAVRGHAIFSRINPLW
eukprot:TRINITY_DN66702_c0_g1_i1.p1 TRINITY_DN66702_c0_g1~~TRINITY_DN66702_c0_g1_i1.p1  ORF type:complete len:211 (+),score=74.30 TRINITY_DN66702_c0_g1_i1:86-634(+)